MGFRDNFTAMNDSFASAFGESVTYTPAGSATTSTVTLVVSEDETVDEINPGNMAEQITGEVVFSSDDIASPDPQDKITRSDGYHWYFVRELYRYGKMVGWMVRSNQRQRV